MKIIPRISSKDNKQERSSLTLSYLQFFLKLIKINESGDQVKTIFIQKVTLRKSQGSDQKQLL